jgi:hypothetical protein
MVNFDDASVAGALLGKKSFSTPSSYLAEHLLTSTAPGSRNRLVNCIVSRGAVASRRTDPKDLSEMMGALSSLPSDVCSVFISPAIVTTSSLMETVRLSFENPGVSAVTVKASSAGSVAEAKCQDLSLR